ncbi:hypothetical protein, partial [Staphylococcus aureus]|uniref:hypothetical protein n=1 Tax=Staphylococcus aureus TaxID=1280 RepID=UPI0039BDFA81
INPIEIENPETAFEALNKVVELDQKNFMVKANKKNDPYEEIKKKIDVETGDKIKELKIKGVNVFKDRWRYYPGGETASHALWFLSYKGDVFGANYGLETEYDEVLSRSEDNTYANFFTEIFHGIKNNVVDRKELAGDIILSIEPTVQGSLEDELAKT